MVDKLCGELKAYRYKVDDRMELTPGFKFNDWEMRGIPLRIEIGPKDVAKSSVVLARRDIPGKEGKSSAMLQGIEKEVGDMLSKIQQSLYQKAVEFRDAHIHQPGDYDELKEIVTNGWAFAPWCGSAECENNVKEETKATIRCIPLDQPHEAGACICCGKPATQKVYFAKAY